MNEAVQSTTEAISLINDPAIRILLSALFLAIISVSYSGYKFIKSLMSKLEVKEKEIVDAYTLIYKDSKANLELVLAFENKLESHIQADSILRQDIRELTKTAEIIKMKLEDLIQK